MWMLRVSIPTGEMKKPFSQPTGSVVTFVLIDTTTVTAAATMSPASDQMACRTYGYRRCRPKRPETIRFMYISENYAC